MKQEDIIRMAREVNNGKVRVWEDCHLLYPDELERFAELVFEQGRQEGMKQERALWTLTKLGQEIEAQPAQKDAARYQHIKGMARAMSLDMDGNHYWHMGLRDIRGPNLDEAIDRAIKAEGQA